MLLYSAIFVAILPYVFGLKSPRIAIIGGGIGGASCAHFLKKAFPPDVSITLFEQGEIGGRASTIDINGQSYEAGASIIHPKNKYLSDFAKLLDLEHKRADVGLLGIYDGQKIVFQESTWSLTRSVQRLWRYGFNAFRLQNLITSVLNDFTGIYSAQEQGYAYTTVAGLLKQMNPLLWNLTQETFLLYLKKEGFSGLFVEEMVQAITLINYGQTVNMSAFPGAIAVAGADPGQWSIQGGNKLVPAKLLKKSKAKIVHGEIIEVLLEELGTFALSWKDRFQNDIPSQETFDIVVLTAPLIKGMSKIQFKNFPTDFSEYEKPFERIVTTFVCGKLNSSAFQMHHVPEEILTNNETLMFNSISAVHPVSDTDSGEKTVYRIFSREPLTEEEIHTLFVDVEEVKAKDWMAYPHYTPPEVIPPFMLYSGLYYTNAIEWASSAMEMSAIGGKNVALLAYNQWSSKMNLIDNTLKVVRDEL